ncbi:MAG: hypothetical protein JWN02_1357 [Acidobacteria bacterium]|nr:hypothetical protein [Acidobacteriota bacterium]
MRTPAALSALLLSSLLVLPASSQTPTPASPAPAPAVPAPPAAPAASADDTARRAIDVLAGPAWEKSRFFSFSFNVERGGKIAASFAQKWDRFTGDYRVEGKNQAGDTLMVIMNVNTRKGKAWKNGEEMTDATELLNFGYRRFVNDIYWLLMPLKALDPGVHREAGGERTDNCGHAWDLVKLSFDPGVGLTSSDVYWMWVNRDTGMVDEWDMKLQGSPPAERPLEVVFHDYRRINGVLISTRREIRDKGQTIRLDDLVIAPDVPKGAFVK